MAYRQYNFVINRYNRTQVVPRQRNCNGFTVTNLGDTTILVNGAILFPSATPLTAQGDSKSFGGNEGETYIGYIQLTFQFPIGAAPLAEIIQKFYIDIP